jgi:hypothetical protein
MSLKEDLQTLSDTVPLLGRNFAEVLHWASALEAAAQDLQHEVDAARSEAATELATLHDALPGLAVQVEAEEKQLEDAGAAVTSAWQNGSPELEKDGEQVANRVDEVVDRAHDLQLIVAEAATMVDRSRALGDAALSRLQHDAEDANQRIQAALQTMKTDVSNFGAFTETMRHQLEAAAGKLLFRLTAAGSMEMGSAEETMGAFRAKGREYKDAAHGALSSLSQQVMDQVDTEGEKVEHDLTTPMGEAAASVRDELERLAAAAGKQEVALAGHGQALAVALGQAKGEADPVRTGIGQIQDAAREAGLT